MLHSHRIPCSRVPVPLFIFLRRTTPSHFHLHERPSHGYSISAAHSMFPTRPRLLAFLLRSSLFPACPLAVLHAHARSLSHPLAFPLCDRCFPHARSLFPARPRPLAFPLCACCSLHNRSLRTPARCFPHAHTRSPFPTSPLPVHPLAASCFLLCLVLPPPPCASSSASRFPSASPHQRSQARCRTR
jgi:hypothetical protein